MAEIDLEGLLRSAASATVYPAAPDLRGRVAQRLASGAAASALSLTLSRPRARGPVVARLVMSLVIAVAVIVAALAIEPSREAIARFFGVKGSVIDVVPAGSIPTPAVGQGGGLTPAVPLATPSPLDAIAAATGFEVKVPAGYTPKLASTVSMGSDRVALLQFEDFDLWEARLEQEASFGKTVEAGSVTRQLTVRGRPAVWLSGGPHVVYYRDSRGAWVTSSTRIVGRSTLVWRTDYAFYRIETSLPLEQALKIAETLP